MTEVLAALRLQEAYADFERSSAALTPAEFDRDWTAFLTESQAWL